MNRVVTKAEPWQIFLVFLSSMIVLGIIPNNQEELKVIGTILLAVVIFGWFLVLGTSLNENLPEVQQRSDTFFIISCIYAILFVSLSAIFKTSHIDASTSQYLIVAVVFFGISFFYSIYFVSSLFIENQEIFQERDKLSTEVVFILFIIFIVGVLILQSRVKRFFG